MSVSDGRKVVAAAGTAERLSTTSVAVAAVVITAETDNTGVIVVGGSTVVAAQATRRGTPLVAGASIKFTPGDDYVDDLTQVWLDSTVSGDGVTYTYSTLG